MLRSAGLPNIRLYDLCHSAATLGLSAGVSPKIVSEQPGHASVAFTLEDYSHVLLDMQDKAALKVGRAADGCVKCFGAIVRPGPNNCSEISVVPHGTVHDSEATFLEATSCDQLFWLPKFCHLLEHELQSDPAHGFQHAAETGADFQLARFDPSTQNR
jgi:hypothetical protein